jgi:TolB-like protein
MTTVPPARLPELSALFEEALALPARERDEFVSRRTSDPEVRREITRLLSAHERADGFLERLDPSAVAELLEGTGSLDETIGRYRVLRRLGRGGMGVVYLARDPRLDRPVALKLLPAPFGRNAQARERFAEEARAASALDHPHIGTIYEIDETPDGRPYIAMAYYEGGTLAQRVRGGALRVRDALTLGLQIADALAAAHARGLVHCDVKPANVVLTPSGLAKVVDFGIARMLGTAEWGRGAAGTPAYMSPEHLRGEIDPRCDVWSFGVTLYEMLAGYRPFEGTDADAVRRAVRTGDMPSLEERRPDVPLALIDLVHRCLDTDPDRRPADGRALFDELRAIESALRAEPVPAPRRLTRTLRRAAAAIVLAGVLGAAAWLWDRGAPHGIPADAEAIAVMPFGGAAGDTALARLGRELVVTMSTSLDGLGGLSVAEATTVLAQVPPDEMWPLERASALAERLGVGRVVHGMLARVGDAVRLDLGLFDAASLQPLARASVQGPAEDIVAINDSASLAVLRQVWRGRGMPAPSLSAITTSSLPALRAYLEGERAFAGAEFGLAIEAFERAFAADSTFYFAYWRSLYPRVYEGGAPDSAVLARVLAHRHAFPPADRALVESWLEATVSGTRDHLREATARYPDYWPVWYSYGNLLVHQAPYIGSRYADALAALERVVSLNPAFASGWQHLFWMAVQERDTAIALRALTSLERLRLAGSSYIDASTLGFYRSVYERTAARRAPAHLVRRGAEGMARRGPVANPEALASSMLERGFPDEQLRFSHLVLDFAPGPEMAAAQTMGIAFAWAQRGAWDSTLLYARRWTSLDLTHRAALVAYGLAVTGVTLGSVDAVAALAMRPDPVRALPTPTPAEVAELAWLDGVLAHARRDSGGIVNARRRLRGSGAAFAHHLDRSLAAFLLDAGGARPAAAHALAAIEWESGERRLHERFGGDHPFVNAYNRMAAADWLLEIGDTAQAARLLTWHEAVLWSDFYRSEMVNRVVEPLALLQRARIDEAFGLAERARELYTGFLDRYDHAPAAHRALVEEARRAIVRLAPPG